MPKRQSAASSSLMPKTVRRNEEFSKTKYGVRKTPDKEIKHKLSDDYYECLPIKPGCEFFPSLLPYTHKLRKFYLNVPISLFTSGQINYMVYTGSVSC